MKLVGKVFCRHDRKVENGSEIVCVNCGVIIDDKISVMHDIYDTGKSTANLYEKHGIGTKEIIPKTDDGERVRRYFRGGIKGHSSKVNEDLLSKFSNATDNLGMQDKHTEQAWNMFVNTMETESSRYSAEAAVLAIYKTCKMHAKPKTEDEIRNAVRIAWGRKTIKHMTSILYRYMEKENPEEDLKYWFNLNIRKRMNGHRWPPERFELYKRKAWYFVTEIFTEGSPNKRSRVAIKKVFG